MGKGLKQTTMVTMAEENIQMVNKHEKMLNHISQAGNANQSHSEIPFHTYYNGYNKMEGKKEDR